MLSPQDVERLARAYEAAPDSTNDPRVQAMVHAERARIEHAFAQLPIRVRFVEHDPYKSFEHMRDQIQSTGVMYVYQGGSDTPLWDPRTNWMARAVHDYDHLQKTCDFSIEGEAAAYRSSAQCTPGLAPLYMSEILLQAAVANARGTFAQQKLALVSPEIERWASSLRGLRGHAVSRDGEGVGARGRGRGVRMRQQRPSDLAALVWTTAGILRVSTPEAAMVHLRLMGITPMTAMVIIDAANQLNARSDRAA